MTGPSPGGSPPGPGWYPDPQESGWLRWWDGAAWSGWRHQVPPTPSRVGQILGTIAVALVGIVVWLLSVGVLLAENLDDGGSESLDTAKRVAAVVFFGMPLAVAASITAIWLLPVLRRRRNR